MVRAAVAAAAIAMGVAACSSPDPEPAASGSDTGFVGLRGAAPTMLREGRSCEDVLDDFQTFAPAVLDGAARDGSASTTAAFEQRADDSAGAPVAGAEGVDTASAPPAGNAGATSDTNTQEAGIDEPDVVETDGAFVYLVDGDRLVILDGATAEVRSQTQLVGHGAQLLLSGDRLLAITGSHGHGGPVASGIAPEIDVGDVAVAPPAPSGPGEEPIPVDPLPAPVPVEPPSFAAGTVIQLIDVSDRTAPAVVETTELEGQHVSTRVVDGVARVVLASHPRVAPFANGVASTTITDWLPSFRTSTDRGGSTVEGQLVDCEDVLVPEVNAGLAETSVLRVDFEDGFDPSHTTTVVADAGAVYASASTLYVAANRYVSAGDAAGPAPEDWSTAIHAFDLRGEGAATHIGAGEVPGNTLNQYALSEHDGHLRIATTEGTPWGGGQDSESAVRVLRLAGDTFTEVGMVGGLGRTETIHSVRFMGPVGYVVTFRQTDPLYVIDLSDPTAPAALGELKIPGFSSYLHPVGEGRLVGVGRDADQEGNDRGFLLSLFDVSDPTDPRQIQTHTEAGAHSAAGHDPKAFLWWAPESVAVVPMERNGAATEHRPGGAELGLTVFEVDDHGITERATVTADGRYPSRSLVVQDRLWSLFDGGVFVSNLANPTDGAFTGFR